MRILINLILIILLLASVAQAQDKVLVDRWRLEAACRELILLDSLTKDYHQKDSVIIDLKLLDQTRLSEINAHKHRFEEKELQLELSMRTTNNLIIENQIWKRAVKRAKRQRNGIAIGSLGIGLLLLLL